MPLEPIKTPCIGFCEMDRCLGICKGCGRTSGEITNWSIRSDAEKDAIMVQCQRRLGVLYGEDE
jgi:hypothetical protein